MSETDNVVPLGVVEAVKAPIRHALIDWPENPLSSLVLAMLAILGGLAWVSFFIFAAILAALGCVLWVCAWIIGGIAGLASSVADKFRAVGGIGS